MIESDSHQRVFLTHLVILPSEYSLVNVQQYQVLVYYNVTKVTVVVVHRKVIFQMYAEIFVTLLRLKLCHDLNVCQGFHSVRFSFAVISLHRVRYSFLFDSEV